MTPLECFFSNHVTLAHSRESFSLHGNVHNYCTWTTSSKVRERSLAMPLTFPCCVGVVSTFGLRPRGGDLPGGKEAAHNNNNSIPLVHGLVSGKQRLYSFLLPSVPLGVRRILLWPCHGDVYLSVVGTASRRFEKKKRGKI